MGELRVSKDDVGTTDGCHDETTIAATHRHLREAIEAVGLGYDVGGCVEIGEGGATSTFFFGAAGPAPTYSESRGRKTRDRLWSMPLSEAHELGLLRLGDPPPDGKSEPAWQRRVLIEALAKHEAKRRTWAVRSTPVGGIATAAPT